MAPIPLLTVLQFTLPLLMGKLALLPLPPLVGMLDQLNPVRTLDMLLLVVTPE